MKYLFKTLNQQKQPYKVTLILYLLLTLAVSITIVASTSITGSMAQAAATLDTATLFNFLLILTIVMAIRVATSALSALLLGRFNAVVGYRFRHNFAQHFLRRPFANMPGTGESLSIYTNDLPGAIQLVAEGGLQMLGDFIGIIIYFVFMLTINVPMTLIFFAAFPLLTVMQMVIAAPISKKQAARLQARATFTAEVNDNLQNLQAVKAYSLEEMANARYHKAFGGIISHTKIVIKAYATLIIAGVLASQLPTFFIMVFAAHRVINGHMNLAEFIAFVSICGEAGGWLSMLSQRQGQVQMAAGGAQRLLEATDTPLEDTTTGQAFAPRGDVAVRAENLTFGYTPETTVLNAINFTIAKGQKVALVGGSGSGKSTVLKLLLGLYPPDAGVLAVSGHSIEDISLASLRENLAYVPQDSYLFPQSIGENITGEAKITDLPRLEKACADAGILDFIYTLPDKFDAELTESAQNISGGQKQRIALARAFYRNADMILFDEATSALDPGTEDEILQRFRHVDCTVVMVAHRIKPILFCDTIVVMEQGHVVGMGTHDELIEGCPEYQKLYAAFS